MGPLRSLADIRSKNEHLLSQSKESNTTSSSLKPLTVHGNINSIAAPISELGVFEDISPNMFGCAGITQLWLFTSRY
jgi:hypothetical protein